MNLRLRKSSLRDLDAIARVVAASSYQEPANAWKYPDRDRYPDDAYKCLRVDYLKYIRNDEQRWHCMVTEKVEQNDKDATIIAVALWEVSAIPELAHEKPHSSSFRPDQAVLSGTEQAVDESCTRRDAAPRRLQAWKDTLPPYRKANMTSKWGPNLHLQYVGTQPEFQRHGAATVLLKWGIATAQEHNLWIGLFGSPMGSLFYKHLGFEVVGDVKVQAEGEEEYVVVTAMGLPPSKADEAAERLDKL